ncbi:hypothetical protein GPECTOR_4g856 [Gonium pectorale]|uniref:Uncharacterized protein n=1 Tax=Gonium pectorale TaxID=33097 RepID=A0A150GY96_GONPE|nr:hypothetical protein GPECTOR_4g856 [Gonium pectorale]|eukprot:KXZ54785.1 hypothetical protein GPECTOR_4g856 [Gonium pectorale]
MRLSSLNKVTLVAGSREEAGQRDGEGGQARFTFGDSASLVADGAGALYVTSADCVRKATVGAAGPAQVAYPAWYANLHDHYDYYCDDYGDEYLYSEAMRHIAAIAYACEGAALVGFSNNGYCTRLPLAGQPLDLVAKLLPGCPLDGNALTILGTSLHLTKAAVATAGRCDGSPSPPLRAVLKSDMRRDLNKWGSSPKWL